MPIEAKIVGGKGKNSTVSEAHVHPFKLAGENIHHGLVTLTERFINTEPSTKFFLNETQGAAMNKSVVFGGAGKRSTVIHQGVVSGTVLSGTTDVTPQANKLVDASGGMDGSVGPGSLVHNTTVDEYAIVTNVDSNTLLSLDADIMDGGSENFDINHIWTGTAVQGTWNFADNNEFTITNGKNNDEATFNIDSAHVWKSKHFVAFAGKVHLATYAASTNRIKLEFGLDGVLVGNSIDIDDYIDTGDFSAQNFIVPIADLGLSDSNINSMRLSFTVTSGTKPDIAFDDFRLENTGTPLVYSLTVNKGERFHIEELVFAYKDLWDSIVTIAGDTQQAQATVLDPDGFIGVPSLTNGFVITRKKRGKTLFSVTIKDIGSHIAAGALLTEIFTSYDKSSTMAVVRAQFRQPLILTGDFDDTLTIQINDDMSGLERFTVAARGSIEVPR